MANHSKWPSKVFKHRSQGPKSSGQLGIIGKVRNRTRNIKQPEAVPLMVKLEDIVKAKGQDGTREREIKTRP